MMQLVRKCFLDLAAVRGGWAAPGYAVLTAPCEGTLFKHAMPLAPSVDRGYKYSRPGGPDNPDRRDDPTVPVAESAWFRGVAETCLRTAMTGDITSARSPQPQRHILRRNSWSPTNLRI